MFFFFFLLSTMEVLNFFFFFQAEDGIRDKLVTGVKTCALPIFFARCGLSFRPVEAGTGAIGGSLSHEFQVLASSGEDAIVSCDRCDYAANVEKAEVRPLPAPAGGAGGALERVATPGQRTVEEVSRFLGLPPERFVKTLLYRTASGATVAVLVRGDHEASETKVQAVLGEPVALADEE